MTILFKVKKRLVFYVYYLYAVLLLFLNRKEYRGTKKDIAMAFLLLKKKYRKWLDDLPSSISHTHEYNNVVWWCWLQGEDKAPKIVKACLNSIKRGLKDREVVVLTLKNYHKYIKLPDYIEEKFRDGLIPNAQFSDLLRLELLTKFGGTWIDSTVLCTSYDKNLFDEDLFVFKNEMGNEKAIVASNWFITSEKENPILLVTKELLYRYWKENDYMIHYYIFHFFFKMATEKYANDYRKMRRYSNVPPHAMQQELGELFSEKRFQELVATSSVHKLKHEDYAGNKTLFSYIINRYKD